MARARRHFRSDEIEFGEFTWLRTGVVMGDDGFTNLLHYVPMAQNPWHYEDGTGTGTAAPVYDGTGTDRVAFRITPTVAGTHILYKRVQLPRDLHTAWPTGGLSIITRRSGAATSTTLTLRRGGAADATVNGSTIFPGSASTWTAFTFTPGTAYSGGDWVTFVVTYTSTAALSTFDVADLELLYKTLRGNA